MTPFDIVSITPRWLENNGTPVIFKKTILNLLQTIYELLTSCLSSSCNALTNLWSSNDVLMKFSWSSYEVFMKFLWSSYEVLMKFLQTSYKLLTNFLQISYKLLTNFLQTSYKLLTNFIQTSYKLLTIFIQLLATIYLMQVRIEICYVNFWAIKHRIMKVNNVYCIKSSWSKLVSTRSSTVLSLPFSKGSLL